MNVSYPFLLAVYADYAEGQITENDFEQILCLVENYVFRRAICGIPTNSLNKTFANLYATVHKQMRLEDGYLESVKAALMLLGGYKRFPSDSEFYNELLTKDVYNFRSRNYLLERLENYGRKEPIVVDEYTIEHILPQNSDLSLKWQAMLGEQWQQVQEECLHRLGNITLTGYNSELSDRSYSEKKAMEGGFDDSPLRLNSYLRTTEKWNQDTIAKRGEILADKAAKIWFAPKLDEEVLTKYRPEKRNTEQYTLDHYEYLKGNMLMLYQRLKQRVMNIDSSVTEEYKKLYIAFKSSTNFVDVVPQKSRLRLSLNIPYPDIIDPKGLCRDVTNIGRWGNGDVEIGLSAMDELEYVMELIQQAFEEQMVTE